MEREIKKLKVFKTNNFLLVLIIPFFFDLFYYSRSFFGDLVHFISLIMVFISFFLILVVNYLLPLDKEIKKDFNKEFRYFSTLEFVFAVLTAILGGIWYFSLGFTELIQIVNKNIL